MSVTRLGSLCFLAIASAAGFLGAAYAWRDAPKDAPESKAVKAVLEEQVAAWNAGDLDRFLTTYWDSDELTFFSGGTVSKGHKAVAERYRKNYRADGKEMGKLSFSDMEVQPLGPDAALARARWKLVTSKEKVGGLFTLVLRKLKGGWKIVHDHTSKADPS